MFQNGVAGSYKKCYNKLNFNALHMQMRNKGKGGISLEIW